MPMDDLVKVFSFDCKGKCNLCDLCGPNTQEVPECYLFCRKGKDQCLKTCQTGKVICYGCVKYCQKWINQNVFMEKTIFKSPNLFGSSKFRRKSSILIIYVLIKFF